MQIEVLKGVEDAWSEKWSRFIQAAHHQHPRQSLIFAPVDRALNRLPVYVVGHVDGEIRAVAMLGFKRHRFFPSAYVEANSFNGPVCDDPDDLRQFLQDIAQNAFFRRVGRIRVTPYWTGDDADKFITIARNAGWTFAGDRDYLDTGIIDVRRSEADLLSSFSKSAYRAVARAGHRGVTVKMITDERDALVFLEMLNRLGDRRGFERTDKAAFLVSFHEIYKPADIGTIIGAYKDGVLLSGLQLYRGPHIAHARHFASDMDALKKLSNLRISPILWLAGMKWAADKGCHFLDVDGYRKTVAETHRMYNIFKYKGEFNPIPIKRTPEHYITTNALIDWPVYVRMKSMMIARTIVRKYIPKKMIPPLRKMIGLLSMSRRGQQ